MSKSYLSRLTLLLTDRERALFRTLSTGPKIQDYLDRLPINFEVQGETYMSPRRVIKTRTAHCFEGALLAATALALQGERPLLMDFRTIPSDQDHVVTLFRQNRRWGAISKTNHTILRYRDPVYRSPRELAMSYFHEYCKSNGQKSLIAYSAPFDLRRFAPQTWVTEPDELDWLVNALDACRHFPIAPKTALRRTRRASRVELKAMKIVEWKPPRGAKI